MVDELQWNENYAYISNISVTAMTDDENYTQYWFTFASSEYGHQIYANAIGEPPLVSTPCPWDIYFVLSDWQLRLKSHISYKSQQF